MGLEFRVQSLEGSGITDMILLDRLYRGCHPKSNSLLYTKQHNKCSAALGAGRCLP